ncbi:MAG: DUF2142 domain-containing protein [Tropheryma whipplei]|nr:DUF2142 domain-containing protein [Tropheryma whipplei]
MSDSDTNSIPLTRSALRKIEKSSAAGASGLRRLRLAVLVPLLLFISLAGWALSSPIGSSPDDDFHLASAWCALGDRPGLCESSGIKDAKKVPNTILDTWHGKGSRHGNLYCFLNGVSPECQNKWLGNTDHKMQDTGRVNFGSNAQYTNLYYSAMGLLASDDVRASVWGMRLINAFIFTALSLLLYLALPQPRRAALLITWSLSLVPAAMFFIPSSNPSSWAFIGVPSTFFAMLSFFETRGRRKICLGIIAVFSVLLSAFARSDAAIYALLAIVISGILQVRDFKNPWAQFALPVALGIMSIATFFMYPLNVAATGLPATGARDYGFITFVKNIIFIPSSFLPSVFAPQFLGWLDVPLYPPAYVFVAIAALIIVGFALGVGGVRKLFAVLLTLAALIIAPLYVSQVAGITADKLLQPRYLAPLAIIFIAVVLYTGFGEVLQIKKRYMAVIFFLIAPANAFGIFSLLRHYDALPSFLGGALPPTSDGPNAGTSRDVLAGHHSSGSIAAPDGASTSGEHSGSWWWPGFPVSPILLFSVVVASFTLALLIALRDVLKIRNEVNIANETEKALARARRLSISNTPALVNVGTGMITLSKISNATASITLEDAEGQS